MTRGQVGQSCVTVLTEDEACDILDVWTAGTDEVAEDATLVNVVRGQVGHG